MISKDKLDLVKNALELPARTPLTLLPYFLAISAMIFTAIPAIIALQPSYDSQVFKELQQEFDAQRKYIGQVNGMSQPKPAIQDQYGLLGQRVQLIVSRQSLEVKPVAVATSIWGSFVDKAERSLEGLKLEDRRRTDWVFRYLMAIIIFLITGIALAFLERHHQMKATQYEAIVTHAAINVIKIADSDSYKNKKPAVRKQIASMIMEAKKDIRCSMSMLWVIAYWFCNVCACILTLCARRPSKESKWPQAILFRRWIAKTRIRIGRYAKGSSQLPPKFWNRLNTSLSEVQ